MSTTSRRQRRRPARQQQSSQRRSPERVRAPAEPVDYTQDYNYVRHDLKRIALWSLLLFAGIIGVSFVI